MQDVIYVDEGIEEVTEVYPTQVLPRTGSSVGRAAALTTPKPGAASTSIVVRESCSVVPASPKSLSRTSSLSNWAIEQTCCLPTFAGEQQGGWSSVDTFYTDIVRVIKYPRLSCLCVVATELWPNFKNRVSAWYARTGCVTYTSDYLASSILFCFFTKKYLGQLHNCFCFELSLHSCPCFLNFASLPLVFKIEGTVCPFLSTRLAGPQ